jgi:hypothetical protein
MALLETSPFTDSWHVPLAILWQPHGEIPDRNGGFVGNSTINDEVFMYS